MNKMNFQNSRSPTKWKLRLVEIRKSKFQFSPTQIKAYLRGGIIIKKQEHFGLFPK